MSDQIAINLIDECIEYSEKKYKFLPVAIEERIIIILSFFKNKTIQAKDPQEIGDLIASLAELIPIDSPLFSDFCITIGNVCVDRTFARFADEALDTIVKTLISNLSIPSSDPSPAFRCLSTLFYQNTLRLVEHHDKILELAISLGS